MIRRAALSSVLLFVVACGASPVVRPELLVYVESDVAGLDAVHVDVTDSAGAPELSQSFVLGSGAGQVRLPFSFGVAPLGGDASRVVTITVEGRVAGATRVRSIVRSGFVAGDERRIDVFLARVCEPLFASCEAMSQTCRDGACVSPMLDVTMLPSTRPGDAGTGSADAGPACATSIGPLACGTSVVMADTFEGSSVLETNSCPSLLRYRGNEGIHTFTTTTQATVHITSHRTGETSTAYDLFVLGGAAGMTCDSAAACAGWDSNGSDVDHVDFVASPAAPYYVVFDTDDVTVTTTYSLEISCDLCGDGATTAPEQCDDGNNTSGDGCAAGCTIEPGFSCSGSPSTCHTTCGDGTLQRGETCDDGNTGDGDGCSATCRAEVFTAISLDAPSVIVPGSLDPTDMTFDRTLADCMTGSGFFVHYDPYVIENTGTAPIVLTVDAAWMGDGWLVVYGPPFDATMAAEGCLLADDNYMGNPSESRLDGVTVGPGAQVILLATEFEALSAPGAYTLSLSARPP